MSSDPSKLIIALLALACKWQGLHDGSHTEQPENVCVRRASVASLALDAPPRMDRARPGRLELTWALPGHGKVALGLACVFRMGFAQFRKPPPVVELDEGERLLTATPRALITHGPFAYSRNPTYLAATFIWLGWAIFYGSVVQLITPHGARMPSRSFSDKRSLRPAKMTHRWDPYSEECSSSGSRTSIALS